MNDQMSIFDEFDSVLEDKKITSNAKIKGQIFSAVLTKKELKLIDRLDSLKEIFPEQIEKNTALHLVSSDNFGSIELLQLMIENEQPEEIHISTFSYNTHFIELLRKYLKTIKITLFIDSTIKNRKPHLYSQAVNLKDDFKNFDVKFHYMLHQKVTLYKTKNKHITVESSANYSKNQRLEQFTITENKELFNFHKKIMLDIIKDVKAKLS